MSVSHPPLATAQHAVLASLLTRYSPWPLMGPAPAPEELEMVFDAALRAPDHGSLHPWRFVCIRDEARHAFGEVLAQAAHLRDPTDDGARFRAKASAAPLIIVLGAHIRAPHKVPEIEQVLAVGAGAMNMLNALHALGYGGFWATGMNAYDPHVKAALGFAPTDQILGFMYVGTPEAGSMTATRPVRDAFVREWMGPVTP